MSAVHPDETWVPLVVTTVSNVLLETYIMGVIGIELENNYGYSRTTVATVSALHVATLYFFGVFGSGLYRKYGCRLPIILGGSISAASYLAAAFTFRNPALLCTFVGLLSGIGHSMIYSPTMIVVNKYYLKRRQLANGIVTSGTGIGTFLIPPIHTMLLRTFGVSGTYMILAGFELHHIVMAMLIPPLAKTTSFCENYGFEYTKIEPFCSEKDCENNDKREESEFEKTQIYGTMEHPQQLQRQEDTLSSHKNNNMDFGKYLKILKYDFLAVDLLKNKTYILLTFGVVFFEPGMAHVMFTYLPDFAAQSGSFIWLSWLPLTILGIMNFLARVISGLIDKSNKTMWMIVILCQFFAFVVFLTLPFTKNCFILICIEAGLYGAFSGFLLSMRYILTSVTVDEHDVDRAIGLQCTLTGTLFTLTPILGQLFDKTHSYMATFFTVAFLQFLSLTCRSSACLLYYRQ